MLAAPRAKPRDRWAPGEPRHGLCGDNSSNFRPLLLMIEILCITLRTLNYGNYGIFLIRGHAGFISSTVAVIPAVFYKEAFAGLLLGPLLPARTLPDPRPEVEGPCFALRGLAMAPAIKKS